LVFAAVFAACESEQVGPTRLYDLAGTYRLSAVNGQALPVDLVSPDGNRKVSFVGGTLDVGAATSDAPSLSSGTSSGEYTLRLDVHVTFVPRALEVDTFSVYEGSYGAGSVVIELHGDWALRRQLLFSGTHREGRVELLSHRDPYAVGRLDLLFER
ncbi:MAG: hypothetical protein ACREKI_04380, partial [Gemmatimonadota bacterium]